MRSSSLYSAWVRPIRLTLVFHQLQIHSTNLKLPSKGECRIRHRGARIVACDQ